MKNNGRLKRYVIVLVGLGLLLAGCWDRKEINDLAIVLATGIDYEDGRVELTAQIFIPRKASGGAGGGTGGAGESSPSGVTMVRTAEGSTIAEALNRLQRKVPRNMFWGHCEVVVISEEAGKQGLREYIDFLLRYPQFREHAYVFSSAEPTKELLALLDPLERSSAESLREMANMKLGTRVTVLDLAQSLEGPSRSAILSRMLILPPDPGQSKQTTTPYIKGLSIYKNGRYVRTAKEPLSVGMLLLSNELNNIIMPVELEREKGAFSIRPFEMKTELIPHVKGKDWSMEIKVRSKGEVVLNTTNANLTDPSKMVELEKAWSYRLKSLAEEALELAQHELQADLYKFSVEFRRHYPEQWKERHREWDSVFSNLDVKVDVRARIARTGKSTDPQGITEQSAD